MDAFANELLDAMGGTTAVAGFAHTGVSTVHNWRKSGLSPSRADHLRRIAEAHFPDLDVSALAQKHHFRFPPTPVVDPSNTETGGLRSPGNASNVSAGVSE